MKCQPELVSALLDDELERAMQARVVRHLLQCPHCRQRLATLGLARELPGGKLWPFDPEALTKAIMKKISQIHPPNSTRRASPSAIWYRFAN